MSNRALVHTAMLAESSASTAYADSIYAGRLGERSIAAQQRRYDEAKAIRSRSRWQR